jgi:hypothetical protein
MVTTDTAMTALNRPGPRAVTMAMASSSAGNASITSITRITPLSKRPPMKPDTRPANVPMSTANDTAATPATSDTRAP